MERFFTTGGFMPHGHCYLWNPWLVWLNVIADGLTAGAYTTIPFALFYIVRKRGQSPFNWVVLCFATFIIACGATHLLEIYTLWVPDYWVLGGAKALTAAASVPTAVLLAKYVPAVVNLPTADRMAAVMEELRQSQAVLETRVRERTEELTQKNEQLAQESLERRKAEEALRTKETQMRRLADAGVIGIIVTDFAGGVVEANDQFLKMIGYTREELVKGLIRWDELTPPEYREGNARSIAQLRESGIATQKEKAYFHKSGAQVPVLVGGALIEEGKTEVISFVLDLTEQRKAEAQIATLEAQKAVDAKFKAMLEATPDAVVIANAEGRISFVNQQTKALFGYTQQELVGQPVEFLMPERLRPEAFERRVSYLANPRPYQPQREMSCQRKDGSEFPVEVSMRPLVTDDGLLVMTAIRDVSARRVMESALRASNSELEAFSYSVAHDLRTPLRGINGFAKVLADDYRDVLDADGKHSLQKIQDSAVQMAALIDALLSLARVTRSELRFERVDLSAVAVDICAAMKAANPERSVEVVIEPGLSANSDSALVHALLENLLENAWKFTQRSAHPRIELGVTTQEGKRVFFVRDNGAGFDMAHSGKLFRSFQRLHAPREFGGTGIGLATCHRIVERHGGRIWAEAEVSRGATFYFWLPENRAAPGAPS